jgi:gas vesicle protein
MADGYDRFDNNEGSGGGSFVMGLLTGTVLGAGLGMLFAPKAGAELRGQLSEQAGNIANQASEGYRRASENAGQWVEKGKDAAGEWTERGKDIYGKAKEAVNKGADEAQKYVRDAANVVASNVPSTASASSTSGSSYGSGSSFGSGSSSTPAGSTPGTTGGTRRS